MAADYKRIHRLLRIYTLIQGEQGWTAKKLAETCATSARNIFRDIAVLRKINIPILTDPETKGYFIRKDFYLKPIELTFEESLALISLGRTLHDKEQIPFSAPALKAIAKVRGQLPPGLVRELDLVEEHVEVKLAASATQEAFQTIYDRVQQAIRTRTCLRCQYEAIHVNSAAESNGSSNGKGNGNGRAKAKPEEDYFLLKPYTLFFCQRAWYVVGFHGQRGEVRTLKLNRFTAAKPTGVAYEIPKGFCLQKHLGNAWRMIRGQPTYRVVLRFDAAFAETITDTHWHHTQEFANQDDGSVELTFTIDGLDEIVWWVLSMGAHCRVLQPPELITRVQEEAARMLKLYGETGHGCAPALQPQKKMAKI